MNKKHSEETLEEARLMYMDFISPAQISRSLEIPSTTLHHHINTKWKLERDLKSAELFTQLAESKRNDFVKMTQHSMKIIQRSLEHLATRPAPPTTSEAKNATFILSELDRISRLDEGKATEIFAHEDKAISIDDLRNRIAKDPFALPLAQESKEGSNEVIEEVDFTVIEDSKPNSSDNLN